MLKICYDMLKTKIVLRKKREKKNHTIIVTVTVSNYGNLTLDALIQLLHVVYSIEQHRAEKEHRSIKRPVETIVRRNLI